MLGRNLQVLGSENGIEKTDFEITNSGKGWKQKTSRSLG